MKAHLSGKTYNDKMHQMSKNHGGTGVKVSDKSVALKKFDANAILKRPAKCNSLPKLKSEKIRK